MLITIQHLIIRSKNHNDQKVVARTIVKTEMNLGVVAKTLAVGSAGFASYQ